ncbi:MAG: hypothetical protein ACYC69_03165 [Thermodesulfovibrionales bacterium]
MRFILLILVIAVAIYAVRSLLSALFGKVSSPETPVLQPSKVELDISISDEGKDGLPVITIRSNAATLTIQTVQQEAGQYVVSAEKQADNVAVISINPKKSAGQ